MVVIHPLANDQRHDARIVIRHLANTLAHHLGAQALVSTALLGLFIFAEADLNGFLNFLLCFRFLPLGQGDLFAAGKLRLNRFTPQQPGDNQHQQPATGGHQLIDKRLLFPERQFAAAVIAAVKR